MVNKAYIRLTAGSNLDEKSPCTKVNNRNDNQRVIIQRSIIRRIKKQYGYTFLVLFVISFIYIMSGQKSQTATRDNVMIDTNNESSSSSSSVVGATQITTTSSIHHSDSACLSARQMIPDAILANVTLVDVTRENHQSDTKNEQYATTRKNIKYSMLVFSPTVDKYISKGILDQKRQEQTLTGFIAKALPLLPSSSNTTNNKNKSVHNSDTKGGSSIVWALDIGANLGYHFTYGQTWCSCHCI